MNHNVEAELTILKYLCVNHDPGIISTLSRDWFYSSEHKVILDILQSNGKRLTYAEFSNIADSKYSKLIEVWLKQELFKPDSKSISLEECNSCINIIEDKYKLRLIEEKLLSIRDKLYQGTPSEVETELITYFHNNHSNRESIKNLDEDFNAENLDLIEFNGDEKFGRPGLNRLGALRSTVITIGGDSAHHKTNQLLDILINALIYNFPKNPDFKVMMFSGEMSWGRIRDRIFSKLLHIEHDKIKRRQIEVHEALDLFRTNFPQIQSNFKLIDPKQFRSVSDLSRWVVQFKPDIWGLDFLQYFAQMSAGNNAEMQNKNVMESIATIKILTEVTNSLGIVLSQLRKKNDQRQTHFPRIDDLEWSGLTKQISDVVGMCFWPYKIQPGTAQKNWYVISWQKVRDAEPFNEVLWVDPEFCDFKRHPTPNIGREYINW